MMSIRFWLLVFAVFLALAFAPACSGGFVRSLFENPGDSTVFQVQNLSLSALPTDGGVYQFWYAIDEVNTSILRFIIVGTSLWPVEYLDYEPADLPASLKSYGTLSNTELEIELPEGKSRSDIDTLFLTVEPIGEDDGIMSDSILLSGKLNVRGRANMALDSDNEYSGLPNVFDGTGSIMLAAPTNQPAETSQISAIPSDDTAKGISQDGDTTPPEWIVGYGIISATYNTDDTEIAITFGSAGDADSPPVSYVLYWQAGDSIDFDDNTVKANSILLDITGQDAAPYTSSFTSTEISAIGSTVSLAVHARDSAAPQNETAALDPHPTHPSEKDWLTVTPANPWYKGVWYVNIPDGATEPVASLTLPDLTEVAGWTYESWAYNSADQTLLTLGRFKNPKAVDSDAGGVQAGEGEPYAAPGSDYLSSEYDFRVSTWQFFITVEPEPDTDEAGFAWRLLTVNAKTDVTESEAIPLTPYTGNQPFGVARIL